MTVFFQSIYFKSNPTSLPIPKFQSKNLPEKSILGKVDPLLYEGGGVEGGRDFKLCFKSFSTSTYFYFQKQKDANFTNFFIF